MIIDVDRRRAAGGYSVTDKPSGTVIHVWPEERCLVLEQDGVPIAMRRVPPAIAGLDLSETTARELQLFWSMWSAFRRGEEILVRFGR